MDTLTVENVTYQYEGSKKPIFNHVNMSFEKGKVYAIIGKSGAGKSTMLNLLAGLETATAGTVSFQGSDLAKMNLNHYRSKKAGIIFQGLNLLTNATAIDNLILSMNISGISRGGKKEKAFSLLESVGITKEMANRKILKLSGGQQQRIAIARAMAHNPELIIADEPTGNLDKMTEDGVLKIFTKLAKDDEKCVIIVTHSKKVAGIADEVWGLEKGKFRQITAGKK